MKVPPIDLNIVRVRCGGNEAFATAVVGRFRDQAGEEVDRMEEALAKNQTDNLRRAAHNLKSMSAYISAEVASDMSNQIEQLARAGQMTGISELLVLLRKEIEHVVGWLNENVAPHAAA